MQQSRFGVKLTILNPTVVVVPMRKNEGSGAVETDLEIRSVYFWTLIFLNREIFRCQSSQTARVKSPN